MGQENIRKVLNNLISRMKGMGMQVAGTNYLNRVLRLRVCCFIGFVSNGEHNVLRAMGYTRPVSVLRIKSEVKARYSRMSVKKLCAMITPNGMLHHALIYM